MLYGFDMVSRDKNFDTFEAIPSAGRNAAFSVAASFPLPENLSTPSPAQVATPEAYRGYLKEVLNHCAAVNLPATKPYIIAKSPNGAFTVSVESLDSQGWTPEAA